MEEKAKVNLKKESLIVEIIKEHPIMFGIVVLVVFVVPFFLLVYGHIEFVLRQWYSIIGSIGTFLGLFIALYFGHKQWLNANKNMKNDIQIRRAEFTIQFVKEFRKLMPSMAFCVNLYEHFNSDNKDPIKYPEENKYLNKSNGTEHYKVENHPDIIKLQNELLEVDTFRFSIGQYNELKRKLSIDDKEIAKAKGEFHADTEAIIAIATEHYNKSGLGEFCSFHKLHDQYLKEKWEIDHSASTGREARLKETRMKELNDVYANSILANVQNVINELECNTLSAQFDLLDYDKITNLIFVPFHYYISNLYMLMMENKIEHEKRNYFIYSNIKRLCEEIDDRKKRIDKKMNTENMDSEARKGSIVANATKPKKLEQEL